MKISFFEEFPSTETFDKLELLNFKPKLYLAAKNKKQFLELEGLVKEYGIKDCIFWPVLTKEEGYWLSPFVKKENLLRVFNDANGIKTMFDMEFPINRSLAVKNLLDLNQNKRLLEKLLSSRDSETYLVEHSLTGLGLKFLRNIGLSYKLSNVSMIKMVYSSMHNSISEYRFKQKLAVLKKEYGPHIKIGLGLLATGIHGNEPLISASLLDRDIRCASNSNIGEVIIFRLGGLDKKYASVINKYI